MKEVLYKITENCPCNCEFCKSPDFGIQNKSTNELSLEDWKATTKELIDSGLQIVVISGGEPLLRDDITLPLITYLKENNIFTVLNTSGVMLIRNSKFMVKLKENYPNLLVFSIDSAFQINHDANRKVVGLFQTVIESIRELSNARNFPVCIRVVITNRNFKEIPIIIEKFNKLGIDCIKFTNVENDTKGKYRLTHSDLIHFNKYTKNEIINTLQNCVFYNNQLKEDSIAKFQGLFNPVTVDFELFSKGVFSPYFKGNIPCDIIERYCVIQSNGDILPCCESEHHNFPIYGNVKQFQLNQIFKSLIYLEAQKTRASYCINCTQPHNIQINFTERALTVNKR